MRYRYLYYILLLIPAFLFRDYTPANELKYISIVEEALKNGTWITFYNHGEIYADKPPLFFWLIMLSKLIIGEYRMWLIGLFSLLPSMGVMAIMDRWLKKEGKTFNPLMANLMLLTTVMFVSAALVVRMDMLMTFFIALSLYTFYAIYKDEHAEIEKYTLPVYIFLALFTKGAIGLLIPVASIIVFLVVKKQIHTIGYYLGWRQCLIFVSLCVVWFVLVYIEGGKEYLNDLTFRQTIGRGINSFRHKEPFWFYLPRMLWSFAPWSLLFIVLIWQGIRKKMFSTDIEKFFLSIICTSIVLLSVISSKLDIYLLPVYPFVVYLCAILFVQNINNRAIKTTIAISAILVILILPATIMLRGIIPDYGYSTIAFTGIAMLTIGGITAIIMLFKKQILQAVCAVSFGVVGLVFVGSFAIPSINKYIGFREMAKSTKETMKVSNNAQYAYYKFESASNMDIYLNSSLQQINSVAELDSIVQSGKETILFVRNREIKRDEKFADWIAKFNPEWSAGEYRWYLFGGNN